MGGVIVFEDDVWDSFLPLSLTRHTSEQLFGGRSILEHTRARFGDDVELVGRNYLAEAVSERTGLAYNRNGTTSSKDSGASGERVFIVNSRHNPLVNFKSEITKKADFVLCDHGHVVFGAVKRECFHTALSKDGTLSGKGQSSLAKGVEKLEANEPMLFSYPWNVLHQNGHAIVVEAEKKKGSSDTVKGTVKRRNSVEGGRSDVLISPEAEVEDYVSFDSRHGPIVVEEGVHIESFSRISGPSFIGRDAVVHSALIRGGTSVGESCRVGGEVEHSIIYANSNKGHFGFLGHSIVGEWVNLGAGSVTSNLKNTYGTIKVVRRGRRIDSGMIKLGSIVGDMAKVSIGTMIYGGKTIGVSSRCSGLIDKDLPDFTHFDGHEKREFRVRLDSVIETQARMMPRRGKQMTEAQKSLIRYLYAQTIGGGW